MKRVALLLRTLVADDAVGNDVLGQYRALKEKGVDVRIFAESFAIKDPLPQFPGKLHEFLDRDSTLIYHFAIGWNQGKELLSQAPGRRIVRYHNVTPPEFFEPYSKDGVAACQAGREEVKRLAEWRAERYWGASSYSCVELQQHGVAAEQCDVIPPLHHVDRLQTVDADPNVSAALDDGKINILMVGRMAPNKNHAAAIAAFATYFHNYNCDSRLLLVGSQTADLVTYLQALRHQTWEQGVVGAVEFVGKASLAALKSYYQKAHMLLVTSEHEGFCVPLIEAMSMQTPVVALDTTAVGETLGEAGIAWPTFDAGLFAETIHRLASDPQAASAVGMAGRRRYQQQFSNEAITQRFLSSLQDSAMKI